MLFTKIWQVIVATLNMLAQGYLRALCVHSSLLLTFCNRQAVMNVGDGPTWLGARQTDGELPPGLVSGLYTVSATAVFALAPAGAFA